MAGSLPDFSQSSIADHLRRATGAQPHRIGARDRIPCCERNNFTHARTDLTVAFIKIVCLLALAAACSAFALLVPAHLRTIDRAALAAAAHTAPSNTTRLSESVDAAHFGPALLIAKATGAGSAQALPTASLPRATIAVLGGPDPSLEAFLQQLPPSRYAEARPRPLIPLLLPGDDRELLATHLRTSSNRNVQALLSIRDLQGMTRLHPSSHPAGAPFDAGLLTLAQLIESGHLQPALARQLGRMAPLAATGDQGAIGTIEEVVMATLSLGRQLDYRSLAHLAEFTDEPGAWTDMGALFRAQPERIPLLFTALFFAGESRPLFDYFATHPESADDDLQEALRRGPGALNHLLQEQLPIHQPAPVTGRALQPLDPLRPHALATLAASNRPLALGLKGGLFFAAGLAVALATGVPGRRAAAPSIRPARLAPVVVGRNFTLSLVLALTLWTLFEPEVLQSRSAAVEAAPRLDFSVAAAISSLQSPVKTMQNLNEVTLLVLALFFVLQLVIYCLCLIKIKEIERQPHAPAMKLRLLDNEENLFDFGLYVGLGGTVLSLIMVAIGIVEASLMAAYASTLFGILFVALLKVLHLRPFRRKLIIETDHPPAAAK